jgi:hypothetical protein
MGLPHDICRCFDESCEEREECARWIERQGGASHTPRSESLLPYDVEIGELCPLKIEIDKNIDSEVD